MENLRVERRGALALAEFSGEMANEKVPPLRRELEAALDGPGCRALVLALSGVVFLDSSGIGLLVSLAARAKAAGRTFGLLAPSPQVRKTLQLVRLIAFFRVLESEADLADLE